MGAVDHEDVLTCPPQDDRWDQIPVYERSNQINDFLRRPIGRFSLEVGFPQALDQEGVVSQRANADRARRRPLGRPTFGGEVLPRNQSIKIYSVCWHALELLNRS